MCILENYPECSNPRVFYIIPYFCGQHPQCRHVQVQVKPFIHLFLLEKKNLTVSLFLSGSLVFGLWRGPNRTFRRITSLSASWRSWKMFCSYWRGFYLITSLESSTSTRAPVGALNSSRLVDYSLCETRKVLCSSCCRHIYLSLCPCLC